MNIFEKAARKKLRFNSSRGELTCEQLFDLSLVDLDGIARGANTALKEVSEESFIDSNPHPLKENRSLILDILKHVIASKQADAAAAEQRVERSDKRRKIIEAMAAKEDEALTSKSIKQLQKELEALDE